MPTKSESTVESGSIFGSLKSLPRGPHGLSRDEVMTSQHDRLLASVVELVAANGYVATTITEIAKHAGVSPNVFYEHFASKEECFLAAYDRFATELLARITDGVAEAPDWSQFIEASMQAYLSTLDDERIAARAFLLEMDAAGPEARRRRQIAFSAYSAMIKQQHTQMRQAAPELGELSDHAYLAISMGVRGVVCDQLEADPQARLVDLAPDVAHWVTAMVLGAAAASEELTAHAERRTDS
ncbi:MAG: TetR/AcrR family transcriptional regulator [Solirubrobacterales bacterium]